MPRQKSIETEELQKLLSEYIIENAGEPVTIPEFGSYVRKQGYSVGDYTIRRNAKVREAIDAANRTDEAKVLNDLVAYKTIDVDAFLKKNNTMDRLRSSIAGLDRYYADICAKAAAAIRKKQEVQNENARLEARISELESRLENMQARADKADIRAKNQAIAKLKTILETYVYPEAANELLKKEGILETVNSVVESGLMEKKTIKADSDITEISKYSGVNKLFGGFDDGRQQ